MFPTLEIKDVFQLQSGKCPCRARDTAGAEGPRICSMLLHGHVARTKKLESAGHSRRSDECDCWLAPSGRSPRSHIRASSRPRMTDAGGNSRFPAPAAHDQREREFGDGRPAGRAPPSGSAFTSALLGSSGGVAWTLYRGPEILLRHVGRTQAFVQFHPSGEFSRRRRETIRWERARTHYAGPAPTA